MDALSLPWPQLGAYVKDHVLLHDIQVDGYCIKKGTRVTLKLVGWIEIEPSSVYPENKTFSEGKVFMI